MKVLSNKMFWTITLFIITSIASLGFSILVVLALIKFIFG